MKYIYKYLAYFCNSLLMLSIIVSPIAKASEVEQTMSNLENTPPVEVLEHSTGRLFEEVSSVSSGTVHEFVSGNFLITELLGEEGVVLATKIINQETGEILMVTSASGDTVLEKTVLDDGEYSFEREIHTSLSPEQDAIVFDKQGSAFRSLGGGWEYTGIAVGVKAFETLVNLTMDALISAVAAIFGLAAFIVSAILGYMGAYGLFGSTLANHLDTNKNGWIGVYKRKLNYPPYTYSHRTY